MSSRHSGVAISSDGSTSAWPGFTVEPNDAVVRLCFARPPVNAFTVAMLEDLRSVVRQLEDDPRPLLLAGAGGVFSAGFDIKQPTPSTAPKSTAAAARCLEALQSHPTPVVAAVEGAAVGLGLLIAASADILVISRDARLRMPEVTLGITSDVAPLRRFLPEPWVRRMCLLGEVFTAEQLCLDAAGAQLCDSGAAEGTAARILTAAQGIDTRFLSHTKQSLFMQDRLDRET